MKALPLPVLLALLWMHTCVFAQPATEDKRKPKTLANSIGMKLVLIPAGGFVMGSAKSEKGSSAHERPQHRVRVSQPFYLGQYEVTQEEYLQVMGRNPSQF